MLQRLRRGRARRDRSWRSSVPSWTYSSTMSFLRFWTPWRLPTGSRGWSSRWESLRLRFWKIYDYVIATEFFFGTGRSVLVWFVGSFWDWINFVVSKKNWDVFIHFLVPRGSEVTRNVDPCAYVWKCLLFALIRLKILCYFKDWTGNVARKNSEQFCAPRVPIFWKGTHYGRGSIFLC